MGGQRVEASPPLPPNPESAAGASQPPAPHPEPSHKPTGVWIFCFLIGFKHNKLLIEGGGGDGVGGHRLLSKEEAELRGRVSTQRMELLPHGGLKITKGMGDVKGGRWGGGGEEHRLLAPSKVQDSCLGAAAAPTGAQRLLLCIAVGAAHSLGGREAVMGSGVSWPLLRAAQHIVV